MPELVHEVRGEQNVRWVVALDDGARVEAVLYHSDTLCVSCQVGCGVRCPFCASGADGLGRSLTRDEMRAQVELVMARGHAVKRVTVSGSGEPLHALDAVQDFIGVMRIVRVPTSLTTSGGPPDKLARALRLLHNGLTLSVHAGTEPVRRKMVPHGPTLASLRATLEDVLPTLSSNKRRKIALAYLMVAGENDSDEELRAFASLAVPLEQPVHLYALNPVPTSASRPVSRERYEHAYRLLREAGLVVRMSSVARLEANGGCGTLVALRCPT